MTRTNASTTTVRAVLEKVTLTVQQERIERLQAAGWVEGVESEWARVWRKERWVCKITKKPKGDSG